MKPDITKIRKHADGFRGRFFFDAERGDLAYLADECERKECDCEPSYNADGDIDCSTCIGFMEDGENMGEPIADMLNAVSGLLVECELLTRERDTAYQAGHDNAMSDPRPDIVGTIDAIERVLVLEGELADKTRERDEACRQLRVALAEVEEYKGHTREAYDDRDAAVARAEQADLARDNIEARIIGLIEAALVGPVVVPDDVSRETGRMVEAVRIARRRAENSVPSARAEAAERERDDALRDLHKLVLSTHAALDTAGVPEATRAETRIEALAKQRDDHAAQNEEHKRRISVARRIAWRAAELGGADASSSAIVSILDELE